MVQRFPNLSLDQMSPEQRVIAERALESRRGKFDGTLNVLLRAAPLAEPIERLGVCVRFNGILPERLKELAILVVARHMNAEYPWSIHSALAIRAGIAAGSVAEIAHFREPATLQPDEQELYRVCRSLLNGSPFRDEDYDMLIDRYGEAAIIELVGLVGYYVIVCMVKQLDGVGAPDGHDVLPRRARE